jgi:hypothetical protein
MKPEYSDFDQVPFCERSKWAFLVWILIVVGAIMFWVELFKILDKVTL